MLYDKQADSEGNANNQLLRGNKLPSPELAKKRIPLGCGNRGHAVSGESRQQLVGHSSHEG